MVNYKYSPIIRCSVNRVIIMAQKQTYPQAGTPQQQQTPQQPEQRPQQYYVPVQPAQQAQQVAPQAQPQVPKEGDKKRYLKMAEQGIILVAVITAIVVSLFYLESILGAEYLQLLEIVRLVMFLILIAGLAFIGLTGVREMRTG